MYQVENAERADGDNSARQADDSDHQDYAITALWRWRHAWTRSIWLPWLIDRGLREAGRRKVACLHGLPKLTRNRHSGVSLLLGIARPVIWQDGHGLGGILIELALLLGARRTYR